MLTKGASPDDTKAFWQLCEVEQGCIGEVGDHFEPGDSRDPGGAPRCNDCFGEAQSLLPDLHLVLACEGCVPLHTKADKSDSSI